MNLLVVFTTLFAGTFAQPLLTSTNGTGGAGYNLSATSTCRQLQRSGTYKSQYWDLTASSDYLGNFSQTYSGNLFENDFRAPWGRSESWSCSLTGGCLRIECRDLGDQQDQPYSAAAFQNMNAQANLGQVFQKIKESLNNAYSKWSSEQSIYAKTLDPGHDNQKSELAFDQLLSSINTMVAVGAALIEGPEAATAAALVDGIVSSVSTWLGEASGGDSSSDLDRVASLTEPITKYLNGTSSVLSQASDAFLTKGSWDTGLKILSMSDIFKGGAFADFRNIPLLNPNLLSSDASNNIFPKLMSGMVINTAWHQQRVWLMSYPMTEDEFNAHKTYQGQDDPSLAKWVDGRGYYFQSVFPESDGSFVSPVYQNPPGSNAINPSFQISLDDVITSSISSMKEAGFNGNLSSPDWLSGLAFGTKESVDSFIQTLTSQSGIFRIPICDIDDEDEHITNLDEFLTALGPPGSKGNIVPEGEDEQLVASFCHCLNKEDETQVKFRDVVDVGGWEGGNHPFCFVSQKPNNPGSDSPGCTDDPDC